MGFACVACAGGTTNNAGDDPHHYDTTCQKTLCKVNEYVKAHVCTPCSAAHGHTTNTLGDDPAAPIPLAIKARKCFKPEPDHQNGQAFAPEHLTIHSLSTTINLNLLQRRQ